MDQWLDSLSEDWVSQPRSPHSDQLRRSSSALSVASNASNTSQSRIPRFKPRTSSNLAPNGPTSLKRTSSGPVDPNRQRVLRESSSSSLNVSRNNHSITASGPQSPDVGKRVRSKQHASSKSVASVPQDTIQHKTSRVSPAKENDPGSTPEWKRRVLQGKVGNAGLDLFGPIGLENIFKPPTVGRNSKSGEQQKRGKKFQPVAVDDFPSSPPAFPSDLSSIERSGGTDRRRSMLLKQMDILEEVSEGDSRYSLPKVVDPGPRKVHQVMRDGSRKASELTATEDDENEVLSQVVLPEQPDQKQFLPADVKPSLTNEERDHSPTISEAELTGRGPLELHKESIPSTVNASPSSSSDQHLPGGDWTSHSLPDDLSTGTDLYAANGGFVSIRRGGYSNEGSFNRRLLSPSSLPDFDAPELRSPSPTRRLSTSKKSNALEGMVDHPRSGPVTPRRKQHAKSNSADEPLSSGSPLKLFDKYDTFTNDRLIRRLSKYEETIPESEGEPFPKGAKGRGSKAPIIPRSSLQDSQREPDEARASHSSRRISSFGEGQLDNFPFHANHPLMSKSRYTMENRVRAVSSRQDEMIQYQGIEIESHGINEVDIQIDTTQTANGKRLPHSPKKESQAKRRRTLQNSETMKLEIHQYAEQTEKATSVPTKADQDEEICNQDAGPATISGSSVAGKKRKDAKYENDNQVADPKILALRQILRPRTPTPSQRGSQKGPTDEAKPALLTVQDPDYADETPVMDLDHQTQALAGELANFTLNMAQDMTQGARKPSVTTADFFNEAKQIMQLIRNQARPQSSHGVLEEAEEEDEGEPLKPPVDDSTIDEFSRPPSREGGSLRRLREPPQVDARVVSHLRKFEDTDDIGLALPSSVKTMHIKESFDPSLSPNKTVDDDSQHDDSRIQSDPPNIRIRVQAKRKVQMDDDLDPEPKATTTSTVHGSQSSSGPSSGRSVPTGSSRGSRGSGTKAVIAPQVVSHLLSDHVGGMTFDHNKQVWIKRKGSRGSQSLATHSRSGSDITENLFEDIPDLSVDEIDEQQRTHTIVTSVKVLGSASDQISNHNHLPGQPDDDQPSRPQTRDSAITATVDQSSVPSRFSHFASSGAIPETRATSWGDEIVARKSIKVHVQSSNDDLVPDNQNHNEEVEHEISILEGRTSQTPRHSRYGKRQPRVVTVAFSSPLVDHVQTVNVEKNPDDAWDDGSDLDLADSPVREDTRSASASKRRISSKLGKRSVYRSGSRRASIGIARPMSRVDENEELTFLQSFHGPQNSTMNLVLTTPLPASRSILQASGFASAPSSSIGFQLSPLSEFTVHKNDESVDRDVNYDTKHQGFLSAHEVEGKLSLTVQELVKKLTDIEPYEPYWDCIRQVNLRNRNLQTLHMLDEFCSNIEDLDVSDNELDQLHGAPPWIRHLKARGNYLSNITSWSHLRNLQYLDVSSNQISRLVGFQSLVHLRELRANDNQIESLEGILELDGLIKLVLRGNCIKSVDLEASNLARLTDLDLRQNGLANAAHLDHLPALRRLDLSENSLESLNFWEACESLQHLRLANNRLRDLDISRLPTLQSLDIDGNAIARITSIAAHTGLEVLSWREQRLDPGFLEASVQYQQCINVRELYLSGNTLRTFAPSTPMLDLRHLELACTGLQSLSDDFGIKCSNMRVLNLNFNALTELRPLLGLVKLEKLHLAGNRISRLRRTASVLDRIGHELTEIDLRQNPLTLAYYVTQQQPRPFKEQQLMVPSKNMRADVSDDEAFKDMRNCATYILPWATPDADDAARQRLDEDTKIERRVYEMLIALRCKTLRRLDGLCLDRRKVAAKDGVWERLRELGVLKNNENGNAIELEG